MLVSKQFYGKIYLSVYIPEISSKLTVRIMSSTSKPVNLFSCVFLFFSSLLHSCQCIDAIKSDLDQIKEKEVYFEIKDIDPKLLDEFTICGRFKTAKFLTLPSPTQTIFPGLRSVTVIDCEASELLCYFYKQEMGDGHYIKQVFGQILFEEKIQEFNPWLPEVWQSFCYSVQNSTVMITINGHTRHKIHDYRGWLKLYPTFMFMNGMEKKSPFFGSMTDINIWNRKLTDVESSGWMNCAMKIEKGNIFQWKNVSRTLNLKGVRIESINYDNICESNINKDHLIVTNYRLSFFETYSFCQRFGSMAIVQSNETAQQFQQAMRQSSCDAFGAFTGYTDIAEEGNFVEYGSKNDLSWTNWDPEFGQ